MSLFWDADKKAKSVKLFDGEYFAIDIEGYRYHKSTKIIDNNHKQLFTYINRESEGLHILDPELGEAGLSKEVLPSGYDKYQFCGNLLVALYSDDVKVVLLKDGYPVITIDAGNFQTYAWSSFYNYNTNPLSIDSALAVGDKIINAETMNVLFDGVVDYNKLNLPTRKVTYKDGRNHSLNYDLGFMYKTKDVKVYVNLSNMESMKTPLDTEVKPGLGGYFIKNGDVWDYVDYNGDMILEGFIKDVGELEEVRHYNDVNADHLLQILTDINDVQYILSQNKDEIKLK